MSLLTREAVEAMFQKALRASKADETQLVLGGGHLNFVRLQAGDVSENRSERWFELRVAAHVKGAVGIARTTRLDDAGVLAAVKVAHEAAMLAPVVKGALRLPEPARYQESTHYDPEVVELSPAGRLAYVAPLLLESRKHGARAEGFLAARGGSLGPGGVAGMMAMANSRGFFLFHRTTKLRLVARVVADDGAGYAEGEHWLLRQFDSAPIVERALRRALARRKAKDVAPGLYDVILEPGAIAAFLGSLAPHFSADAVEESRSFLRGRQGRAIARSNISLRDDFAHPLHHAAPYDGEGVARKAVPLIDRGVVRSYVYSRRAALREGSVATGHTPLWPPGADAVPSHLVMDGQERSFEELVASTERGILISGVRGHRVLDATRAVCAGQTHNGTFWIEGGKIRHALADLRYEMSAFDVLAYATLLSRPEKAMGVVAPAVKTQKFRILGVAR